MRGDSELIITQEGCIYHLDLRPEEMASTIITVGDPRRVDLVSRHFDRIEIKKSHREFVTNTGYIGAKRISVVSTGIGTGNIDIVMNELDALANVDFKTGQPKDDIQSLNIFRLGTAGAVQAHIMPDSHVVSTFAIGLDNLLYFYRYEQNAEELFILNAFRQHILLNGVPLTPYVTESAVRLLNYFTGFQHGLTVTSPGFYAPQGRKLRLSPGYPTLIDKLTTFNSGNHYIACMEMETAALYGLGKLLHHQCLSINTIVNNRISKTFSVHTAAAIEEMIIRSLSVISQIP